MDALGITLWVITGIVIGLVAELILQYMRRGPIVHDLLYVIPAALLGSFMGSEGFKDPWYFFNSEQGFQRGGFYLVTGIILGVFITLFAALAARAERPMMEEPQ